MQSNVQEQRLLDSVRADCGNAKLSELMADIISFAEHHQFSVSLSLSLFFFIRTDPWYYHGQLVNSQSQARENIPAMKLANYLPVFAFWTGEAGPACQQLIRMWRLCLLSWAPCWYPNQAGCEDSRPSVEQGISDCKQQVNSEFNDKSRPYNELN